ncbi:MAG TPA: sialidase family protein [Candidatus Thermoplasmatota archaeon]|nr:sialidase family protein [Candidatus Thermoplasmatota archaeon]
MLPSALPVFGASLQLFATGPGGIGGEPSVAVAPDGTIYVAAPVIPAATLAGGFLGLADFGQIRVWKSTDGGATFTLLNDENGRLTPKGRGNGDADISVGPDGSVYAIDLGGGIPLYISRDAGATWEGKGNLNDKDTVTDRQWIDVEGELLAVIWANQSAQDVRGIDITLSTDRGETWSHPRPLVDGMIQFGPVEIAPGGTDLYIPYVTFDGRALRVLASHDAGATWADHDTGHAHPRPSYLGTPLPDVEGRWSPTLIFPVLAADKAGNLFLVYSEYVPGGETTQLMMTRSADKGVTWSEPTRVSTSANAVFPWIVAGEAGHVAVAYLASDLPLDPNKGVHEWRLEIAVSRDAADAASFEVAHTVERVHRGSVCSSGGGCTGGLVHVVAYEDRALLDFFEMALTPEGKLVVVWTATEGGADRGPRVMFAAQTEGDGLLALPAAG